MKKLILASAISAISAISVIFMNQVQANPLCDDGEMAWYAEEMLTSHYNDIPIEFMKEEEFTRPGLNDALDAVLKDAYSQPIPHSIRDKMNGINQFVEKWVQQCPVTQVETPSASEMNVLCQYGEMGTYAIRALMFSQSGLDMEYMFSEEEWAPGQHDSMREMVQDAYNQPTNLRPGLQAQNDEAFVNKWQNYCDHQINKAELETIFEIFNIR